MIYSYFTDEETGLQRRHLAGIDDVGMDNQDRLAPAHHFSLKWFFLELCDLSGKSEIKRML
jgi:hypothetical protein